MFLPYRGLEVAKIVLFPWAVFFSLLMFFEMYVEEDVLAILVILAAIALSSVGAVFGQFLGRRISLSHAGYFRNLLDGPGFDESKSLRFVLALGFTCGLIVVTGKASTQMDLLLQFDFYKLRMSVSETKDLASTGLFSNVLMVMFSLSFVSIFLSRRHFKTKFWSLIFSLSVLLVCVYVLLGGGRMVLFYVILLVLLRSFVEGYKISARVFFSSSVVILAMVVLFYFRVPSGVSGALQYYNNFFGLEKNVAFFGFYDGRGLVSDLFYIVGIYFTHSFSVFSDFLYSNASQQLSFGSYTFNLPLRILDVVFGTSLSSGREIDDSSVGYYATFLRDLIADFSLWGALFFAVLISIFAGFFYPLRKFHWSIYVSFYYFSLCLLMAPLISVMSSGLMFIGFFCAFFIACCVIAFFMLIGSLGRRSRDEES